ncbi:hypothetical protein WA158_001738 [Blastocystis sp. Blastoise]
MSGTVSRRPFKRGFNKNDSNKKIVDSNSISLKRKQIKRKQNFNKNSNILHKYKKLKEKEVNKNIPKKINDDEMSDNEEESEDDLQLRQQISTDKENYEDAFVVNADSDDENNNIKEVKDEENNVFVVEDLKKKNENKPKKIIDGKTKPKQRTFTTHKPNMFQEAQKKAEAFNILN